MNKLGPPKNRATHAGRICGCIGCMRGEDCHYHCTNYVEGNV